MASVLKSTVDLLQSPDIGQHTILCGVPASGGRITARARVIEHAAGASRLVRGEIMVCPAVTRELAPLLAVASGVIAETGGVLSSAATTCREYGIPAVFGVGGARNAISDGQLVTIDGIRGIVVLER
jgi:pyruvate,water dikinase